MASSSLIKALGLNISINALEAPEGTLYEASNVIIKRDDVIESRRGYDLFGVPFGTSIDRCKQMADYKSRIIRHYSDKLQFEDELNNDGEMNFKTFYGSYLNTIDGYRFKSIEANGNFYFTTSEGIKKISAKTADDFSTNAGYITQAGGVKALDLSAKLSLVQGETGGFLPKDSVVGYKIVWGVKDANNNLVLGTPSDFANVYNPLLNYLITDFNKLLNNLDSIDQPGSMIDDGDYVQDLLLPQSSDSVTTYNNLVSLCKKIDEDIVFANSAIVGPPLVIGSVSVTSGTVRITFSSGTASNYLSVGDSILLSNFLSGTTLTAVDSLNAVQTISNVSAVLDPTQFIEFIPAQYSQSNPVGVSGSLTIPETPITSSPFSLTLTSTNHGLKTNQRIIITGYSSTPSINGTYDVTVLTPNTFSIPFISAGPFPPGITLQSGTAVWNIDVNGISTSKIESNFFRSLEKPSEPIVPTSNAQLVNLQTYLEIIATELQNLKNAIVSSTLKTNYLNSFTLTQNSNVLLTITIPDDIVENVNFYQVYRTDILTATGTDILSDFTPIQEYRLIEEAFPTFPISAGYLVFEDSTPESTAVVGANLYTNERTGDGALQANDVPPFATDINRFKNYTFYSNTKTRNRKTLNLLPTDAMLNSYDPLNKPKIIFSSSDTDQDVYTFVKGVAQETQVITTAASTFITSANPATYFLINSAYDETKYYIWYSVVGGLMVDPSPPNTDVGIAVVVNSGDLPLVVAQKTADAINSNCFDFICSIGGSTITIEDLSYGLATAASQGTTAFNISSTPGEGENIAAKEVLLSDGGGSTSLAIEETAKSLVRVINRNTSSLINAFYISSTTIGTILFESKSLNTPKFYVMANDLTTGESFFPSISPDLNIVSISTTGSPTTIQTSANHGLASGDQVVILNSGSSVNIDGVQTVASVISPTQFTLNKNVISAGSLGVMDAVKFAESSDNEEQKHRVYYSKILEPEAVPILNYLDVGANDKAILRIFPLRDTLFVFKEDGLYRISGEIAPFSLSLFDSSCILLAPDSLDVANNQIYCWTTQGVSTVTESGVNIISRPIDVDILRIATYPNFKTATWGVGYESDTSYTVYTTKSPTDTQATIGYRYSNLTGTWTTFDKSVICGINKSSDDRLYLGPSDVNFIERERKDFSRYDYADRELSFSLVAGAYSNKSIILSDVSDISIGDVVVQTQTLTVYEFNALLQKLDLDAGVPNNDYYSTLKASSGDNLRSKIEALANKLDSDGLQFNNYYSSINFYTSTISSVSAQNPAVVTTSAPHNLQSGRYVQISGVTGQPKVNGNFKVTYISPTQFSIPVNSNVVGVGGMGAQCVTLVDTFEDIEACFNIIVNKLNLDSVVAFSNYAPIDTTTIQESIIVAVNPNLKTITLNLDLEYVVGELSIFKAIPCSIVYNPNLMGDPLSFKHIREATMMFANKAFTAASLKFSTDLLPELVEVPFNGDGSGIFGHQTFGGNFFGGNSNSAPFRTYIPRQCQRCRFINVGFEHSIAREQFAIYGFTLTGETGISTRAYR
jgi:hypothetical protein